MAYYFVYEKDNPEELEKLIEYIEDNYNLKYKEIRDFPTILKLSIGNFGFELEGKKQIVFDKKLKNIYVCNNCNFICNNQNLITPFPSGVFVCKCCEAPILDPDRSPRHGGNIGRRKI